LKSAPVIAMTPASTAGLNPANDTLIHMLSTPSHACQPQIPDDVNVIARRAPIPLFGAGLVEAIPDELLLALEDPFDRNRDGVSGRAAIVVDVATGHRPRRPVRVEGPTRDTARIRGGRVPQRDGDYELISSRWNSRSACQRPRCGLCDPFPDPEDKRDLRTGRRGIDNFESFMRFLAPVARSHVTEVTLEGERLFSAIGCATCHVPRLTTGPSSHPAFHRRDVDLFSDLLLHDVGTLDGIRQGRGRTVRDPDTRAVGSEVPQAVTARRQRGDDCREHRTPRR
jgi:CxxC motif-containing protein (DUF1111 family)